MDVKTHLEQLAIKWPSSVVSRDRIEQFTGGMISKGRMANLDSLGEGPERFRFGRKVVYPVGPYIDWLIQRSEAIG